MAQSQPAFFYFSCLRSLGDGKINCGAETKTQELALCGKLLSEGEAGSVEEGSGQLALGLKFVINTSL